MAVSGTGCGCIAVINRMSGPIPAGSPAVTAMCCVMQRCLLGYRGLDRSVVAVFLAGQSREQLFRNSGERCLDNRYKHCHGQQAEHRCIHCQCALYAAEAMLETYFEIRKAFFCRKALFSNEAT